jgi:DNA modification methylase
MLHSDGVSLFDPVLSEVIARWFTPTEHSNIVDPFAGDTMKGLVYNIMGHNFTGIELREEQIAINNDAISGRNGIKYICDDGRNVLNHVAEQSQDLLMSCPPYFNLEVYSDLPNDASNQGTYADFIQILRDAYSAAIRTLKPNRFAVIVVGDVRDKDGYYVDFISDVKRIFIDNGMKLYNELILVENIGTGAMVADRYMKSRKMKKTHQNVLVFYNGNTKEIGNVFPAIEVQKEEATH